MRQTPVLSSPTLAGLAKNLGGAVARTAKAAVVHARLRVDAEEAKRRAVICRACPSFLSAAARCSQCGCFLRLKIWLAAENCPTGKW